jgi:glucose-6-phosphate isomerase
LNTNRFDWDKGFLVDFDPVTGRSEMAVSTRRTLSQMKKMYYDQEAVEEILKTEDPVIYEFYELGFPEREGDIAFGTTIVYPGKIGNEYYMTKGHFHTKIDTAEVYWTLKGEGYMIMENKEGDCINMFLSPHQAVYVPRGYSHRSVCTSDEPLIMYFSFQADAGHDYGTIETMGYRKMVVEENGKATIVDNPHWK